MPNIEEATLSSSVSLLETVTHLSHPTPPSTAGPMPSLILPPPPQTTLQASEPVETAASFQDLEVKTSPHIHPATRRMTTTRPVTTSWTTRGIRRTTVRPLSTAPAAPVATQPAYVESGSAEGSGDQELGISGDQEASGASSLGKMGSLADGLHPVPSLLAKFV